MPIAMKKSPSRMPLKGSIAASSSWRYSLSAKSTPAKNAPNAIDIPTDVIANPAPTTSKSATIVEISWTWVVAKSLKSGRVR